MKNKVLFGAKSVALFGVMTALLSSGKMVLSALPNIEVVTLLCALYGYVFGVFGVLPVFLFVLLEVFIWGTGTWVLAYFIHFPSVCLVFVVLRKIKVKNRYVIALFAVFLTALFGVVSSLIDVGLFVPNVENFWKKFSIMYVRGISFYVTETVCNLVLFLFLFPTVSKVLEKIKRRYFS